MHILSRFVVATILIEKKNQNERIIYNTYNHA